MGGSGYNVMIAHLQLSLLYLEILALVMDRFICNLS